jgi:two-component system sensor histidine kinase VicK
VKFAPPRSTVRVRSEVGEEWIRLHLEDEGPGIPSEDLLDIFSGFHQVEKLPTGEVPGAGLGLTIAKRIIHAHHGNITALSPVPETGKGTVITISLPRPGVKEPRPSFQPEVIASS